MLCLFLLVLQWCWYCYTSYCPMCPLDHPHLLQFVFFGCSDCFPLLWFHIIDLLLYRIWPTVYSFECGLHCRNCILPFWLGVFWFLGSCRAVEGLRKFLEHPYNHCFELYLFACFFVFILLNSFSADFFCSFICGMFLCLPVLTASLCLFLCVRPIGYDSQAW